MRGKPITKYIIVVHRFFRNGSAFYPTVPLNKLEAIGVLVTQGRKELMQIVCITEN